MKHASPNFFFRFFDLWAIIITSYGDNKHLMTGIVRRSKCLEYILSAMKEDSVKSSQQTLKNASRAALRFLDDPFHIDIRELTNVVAAIDAAKREFPNNSTLKSYHSIVRFLLEQKKRIANGLPPIELECID